MRRQRRDPKGSLGGDLDVLGKFLGGSKGSSNRSSGVTGSKGGSNNGGVTGELGTVYRRHRNILGGDH